MFLKASHSERLLRDTAAYGTWPGRRSLNLEPKCPVILDLAEGNADGALEGEDVGRFDSCGESVGASEQVSQGCRDGNAYKVRSGTSLRGGRFELGFCLLCAARTQGQSLLLTIGRRDHKAW